LIILSPIQSFDGAGTFQAGTLVILIPFHKFAGWVVSTIPAN
jgi:hypothetical protein